MLHACIGIRSLTYAQRAARILEGRGIRALAVRAPGNSSGCAWCVRVPAAQGEKAVGLLREAGLQPERVYWEGESGAFRERKP